MGHFHRLFGSKDRGLIPVRGIVIAGDPRRFRLGAAYLGGSVSLFVAALVIGGASWLLLWPAAALAAVAVVYIAGRPELFGKSNGAVPVPGLLLLAPYLVCAWFNSRYLRGRRPADEIAGGVWLGRLPVRSERDALGFESIVDLTAELPCNTAGIVYRAVPMLDLLAPTVTQIDAAVSAIAGLENHRPTLVCCALGYSRSAAAVAAWLLATGRAGSMDDAIAATRSRRASIVLPAHYRRVLAEWAAAGRAR